MEAAEAEEEAAGRQAMLGSELQSMVDWLLDREDLDVDARDVLGRTPIYIAAQAGLHRPNPNTNPNLTRTLTSTRTRTRTRRACATLPISPCIYLCPPVSTYISLYLPTSPCISLTRRACATRCGDCSPPGPTPPWDPRGGHRYTRRP